MVKRGDWIDPALGRTSFSDWAHNVMAARLNLRPSSRARNESYLKNHVTPAFEAMSIARIQKIDVQSWVRSLSKDKALAPRTVRECYRIMSGIMAKPWTTASSPTPPAVASRFRKMIDRLFHDVQT